MYLDSSKVKVFPFARFREPENDIASRLFYEENISRLIRQVVDTECFIVSGGINNDGSTSDEGLAINIHGYYFYIKQGTSIVPNTDVPNTDPRTCYVSIQLTSGGAVSELFGQDDEGEFKALNFTANIPTATEGTNVFYVKLAEKTTNNNWVINNELKRKFNFGYSAIDGKH